MSVDSSEVTKLAELARIAISDETLQDVTERLGNVLELVDQLQLVDTAGIAPLAHPLDEVQRLRADDVTEQNQREAFQNIAPQVEDGLYLVPKVID
ncbi:Asp-tRNA(Asn)/Glu-tRNA(Gln) amidotransferase subunit GatC [Biformimicrobium ophioploci]|uniref:Aspartyl/glutamyl-tRNA(Asn/Gln) amidotransferase subunit C n=1 Tax=Biformimicrobium ophioploci TaxID=3036711 RepID=A0ABQ6LX14_9GAMM|nr:Asp-tRNA(Asn)/Glu-tRNA(Gln) amidotransferase subunit GatC [Microbulbifer sp. NKW57]GMG86585.1 Asp-tRNA(Asn)/Glu-tRNA(Gln) amidotransferase subunit GatC [Microbulbifer sp. NKW57]